MGKNRKQHIFLHSIELSDEKKQHEFESVNPKMRKVLMKNRRYQLGTFKRRLL